MYTKKVLEQTSLSVSRDRLSELRDMLPALVTLADKTVTGNIDQASVEMAQMAIDEWLCDSALWEEVDDGNS